MSEPNETAQSDSLPTQFKWLGISLFIWSVLASIVFHASFLIPAFLSEIHVDLDADIEWLQNLDELEGLGSSGRWADVQLPDEPEPEPEHAELEPEPEPEPEPEKPSKPVEKPIAKERKTKPKEESKPTEDPLEIAETSFDREGPSQLPSMEAYGPGNAVYSALIRLDRIRNTPFEEPTKRLIEAVPDYRIALQYTGIDPVRDLDSMFMASAQPQYLEHTFLAVRHRLKEDDIRSRLDRRYENVPAWGEYGKRPTRNLVPENDAYSDPRQIFLPSSGLAILTRPEWLPQLTRRVSEDSPAARGKEKRPTMIQGLRTIEQAALDSDTVVLVSANKIRVRLPGLGVVTFDSVKASIQNLNEPKVTIDLQFKTASRAQKFADECPKMKQTMIKASPLERLARTYLDRLTCQTSDRFVSIVGTYQPAEMQRLVNLAIPFIPRPAMLGKLPPHAPRTLEDHLPKQTKNVGSQTNNGSNGAKPADNNGLPPRTSTNNRAVDSDRPGTNSK